MAAFLSKPNFDWLRFPLLRCLSLVSKCGPRIYSEQISQIHASSKSKGAEHCHKQILLVKESASTGPTDPMISGFRASGHLTAVSNHVSKTVSP